MDNDELHDQWKDRYNDKQEQRIKNIRFAYGSIYFTIGHDEVCLQEGLRQPLDKLEKKVRMWVDLLEVKS